MYASVAAWRRKWYARHPEARRRLAQPVISIGNLTVGGTGKTPIAAHVARLLAGLGERPSILSRGYGRRAAGDGVVVVRDRVRILADVERSGDEPMMLARALDEIAVLVCADRYLAGRLAETHLGCTVHVLDDGFQHVQLDRDADVLLIDPDDLDDARSMPAGRLREPIESAAAADALVVTGGASADEIGRRLGVARTFSATATLGQPRLVEPFGLTSPVARGVRVLAFAGIARPERFFGALKAEGLELAGEMAFRDHHPYTRRDVDRIARSAAEAGVEFALTTEKDLMRLLPLRPLRVPVAWVPMALAVRPEPEFRAWIKERVHAARATGSSSEGLHTGGAGEAA